jgi:hypothetical protein
MKRRSGLLVALLTASLAASAGPGPAGRPVEAAPAPRSEARVRLLVERPAIREPFPFEHRRHARSLRNAGLRCVDCHAVGLAMSADGGREAAAPPADLPPPRSTCHGCHLQTVRGAPFDAPSRCETCHSVRAELRPADHGSDPIRSHAPLARAGTAVCRDCHAAAQCIDCHEERGAGARSPHGPGFAAFHGIEARVDPAPCAGCHSAETCTTCHGEGLKPW